MAYLLLHFVQFSNSYTFTEDDSWNKNINHTSTYNMTKNKMQVLSK